MQAYSQRKYRCIIEECISALKLFRFLPIGKILQTVGEVTSAATISLLLLVRPAE